MDLPTDISKPFFSYGIFKPGQLGYYRIENYVENKKISCYVNHRLLTRDGLPIIHDTIGGSTEGALLEFKDGKEWSGRYYNADGSIRGRFTEGKWKKL